jgi:hypothetical protein
MAMGVVDDKEFERELENSHVNNSPCKSITPSDFNIPDSKVEIIERGRGKNNLEVPNPLRNIIGETHHAQGREAALALAESFGISRSSESAYAEGATSTASYYDRPNRKKVNEVKERIGKKASRITESALDKISDDKLDELSALELTQVAKNVASVVKVMDDSDNDNPQNPLNISAITIYSPQIVNENKFEMVYSKE